MSYRVIERAIIDQKVTKVAGDLYNKNPGDNGWDGKDELMRFETYSAQALGIVLSSYLEYEDLRFISETRYGYVFETVES